MLHPFSYTIHVSRPLSYCPHVCTWVVHRQRRIQFKYDNVAAISHVRWPLLIFHGKADNMVPARNSESLFAAYNETLRECSEGVESLSVSEHTPPSTTTVSTASTLASMANEGVAEGGLGVEESVDSGAVSDNNVVEGRGTVVHEDTSSPNNGTWTGHPNTIHTRHRGLQDSYPSTCPPPSPSVSCANCPRRCSRLVLVNGAGHSNIHQFPEWVYYLSRYISEVEEPRRALHLQSDVHVECERS